jgi:hypothetical protein
VIENKEFLFKGTPYQLAVFAVEFGTRQLENNPLMWQSHPSGELPYRILPKNWKEDRDVNPIVIVMAIDDPNPLIQEELNAQKVNEHTFVTGVFDDFESYRERYESLYAELNRRGLIELQTTPTEPAKGAAQAQDAGLVFTNRGGGWEICYRGESQIQPTSKGIAAIAILLQNPNKEFGAIALAQAIEKNGTTNASLSAGEIAEEGLTISETDDAGDVIDERAKREYRARLDDLEEQKQTATDSGDDDEAEKYQNEIEQIVAEWKLASGLRGQSRKFSGQSEKARTAITKVIDRAIIKLKKRNNALGAYLEMTIETGQRCVYHPEKTEPISITVKL